MLWVLIIQPLGCSRINIYGVDLPQCANPSTSWENLWVVSLQSWRKLQWAFTQDFVFTTCTHFSGEISANVEALFRLCWASTFCGNASPHCWSVNGVTVIVSTNVCLPIQPHFQSVCLALGSIFRDGIRGPCSLCPATCRSSHTALESQSLKERSADPPLVSTWGGQLSSVLFVHWAMVEGPRWSFTVI